MGNWSYKEFKKVVITALEIEDKKVVNLDVEHSDRNNMIQIINWAEAHGYNAEIINDDTIKVWK